MNLDHRKTFLSALGVIALGSGLFLIARPFLPERLFSEIVSGKNIVMDSLMLKAMNEELVVPDEVLRLEDKEVIIDSVKIDFSATTQKPIQQKEVKLISVYNFDFNRIHKTDSLGLGKLPLPLQQVGYTGNEFLKPFFEKLQKLEQDSTASARIAYYGDSMVDGDLIVQDLRSALQTRFGGQGVGFVSIKSKSARSRYSVKHYSRGNWDQQSFMRAASDSIPYGINGFIFRAQDSTAGVTFKASGIKNSYRLNSPQLFYGRGTDSSFLSIKRDKDSLVQKIKLGGSSLLNSMPLSSKDLKKVDLNFGGAIGVPVYGLDFFNEQGITVDGFSNRGNSGMPLSLLNKKTIDWFQKELDYDLIVLQFGANVLSTQAKYFGWYAKKMKIVIAHLNHLFPETPILIMGTADKGSKKEDGTIKTDTAVVRLLRSQQQFAAETGIGFMSLFHLMGGINSMKVWRDHKLANADYTHLSPKGSRKMGLLIYSELMKSYEEYLAEGIAEENKIRVANNSKNRNQENVVND